MQHWWISGFMVASLVMSGTGHAATLDASLGPHTTLSGIGVDSWLEMRRGRVDRAVRWGSSPLPVVARQLSGKDVLDAGACDHAEAGFVSIMNWGRSGRWATHRRGLR